MNVMEGRTGSQLWDSPVGQIPWASRCRILLSLCHLMETEWAVGLVRDNCSAFVVLTICVDLGPQTLITTVLVASRWKC